jgi:hypothetical protein
MELRLPPEALAPATVTCSGCGQTIYEDEAQAARWGYWSDGVGDLYPYCIECATREFAPRRSRELASASRSSCGDTACSVHFPIANAGKR